MSYVPLAGLLVTGSDDGAVRFWNPASGSTVMLRGHENTVSCMCMAHLQRNHFLITGGYDGKIGKLFFFYFSKPSPLTFFFFVLALSSIFFFLRFLGRNEKDEICQTKNGKFIPST
jgi:WD40 repeat protein